MNAPALPFSFPWTLISIVVFTAGEVVIGNVVGPFIGGYVSPMLHIRVMMLVHLVSFYVGGIAVGVFSPGVRMLEPAVGAAVAVLLVFLMSYFMPTTYYEFSLVKFVVSGGLGFSLALGGAYTGERLVGNIDDPQARALRIRRQIWRR